MHYKRKRADFEASSAMSTQPDADLTRVSWLQHDSRAWRDVPIDSKEHGKNSSTDTLAAFQAMPRPSHEPVVRTKLRVATFNVLTHHYPWYTGTGPISSCSVVGLGLQVGLSDPLKAALRTHDPAPAAGDRCRHCGSERSHTPLRGHAAARHLDPADLLRE